MLRPGRIYVARPKLQMRVDIGRVWLTTDPADRDPSGASIPSIDELFMSAAEAYGPATIGVALTGFLRDGAAGIEAIKARGGVTIVEDLAAMPDLTRPLTKPGTIDFCCKVDEIAPLLCRYCAR